MSDQHEILTDANGVPFERPRRDDYLTDAAYFDAYGTYSTAVATAANRAFDAAFRRALKR